MLKLVPSLPPITLSPRLLTLAGRGSLLSAVLLVAGITAGFVADTGASTLLVFCAVVPLLPLVLVLHELHCPEAPRLNTVALVSGLLGIACFGIHACISLFVLATQTPDEVFVQMWWLLIPLLLGPISVGLWLALTGYLALKAETMSPGLRLITCVTGLTYIAVVAIGLLGTLMPEVTAFAGRLYIFLTLVLLPLAHVIWSIWIGGWLLSLDQYQWEQLDYSI